MTTLIANLPNELIYEILKNLTFEQLYHKRTTNKLFWEAYKIYCKKLIKKHVFINKKIFVPIGYEWSNHELIKLPFEEYKVINLKKTKHWYVYLKDNKNEKIYKKKLFITKTQGKVYIKSLSKFTNCSNTYFN